MTAGERLRSRRDALGLTQAKLAAKLGVARETLARWETDAQEIQHPKILELALQMLTADQVMRRRPEAAKAIVDIAAENRGRRRKA